MASTTFPADPNFVPGADSDARMEAQMERTANSALGETKKRKIPNRPYTDHGKLAEKAWARLEKNLQRDTGRS